MREFGGVMLIDYTEWIRVRAYYLGLERTRNGWAGNAESDWLKAEGEFGLNPDHDPGDLGSEERKIHHSPESDSRGAGARYLSFASPFCLT